MLVQASWLREKVQFDATIEEVAERLTLVGLEVEAIEPAWPWLNAVVAARVDAVEPLPDKPGMNLCTMSAGALGTFRVVCGAPGVTPGLVAPFAPPGTEMPDGKTVREMEIYGRMSAGMLCSEKELFMVGDTSGLMVLDGVEPGTPLADALGLSDTVLEIGVTPNRPDCLSVTGVAREAAALFGLPLSRPQPPELPHADEGLFSLSIEAPGLCGRYVGILLEGVEVKDSPRWLALRLLASGVRPINNIVDVTNLVLLDTGQPLHAFDFDTLEGRAIVVRRASEGEEIVTLDGKPRKLDPSVLAICDSTRPVAVAGVMGGQETEVTVVTRRVLIESAWFKPSSIRRTAKRLKLPTEASYRFERGVDPEGQLYAGAIAAGLMTELAGGAVLGFKDECPRPHAPVAVTARVDKINRLVGIELEADDMARLLESIELKVVDQDERRKTISVEVPSFRPDISEEIDLVEEVARLHGFSRIPTRMPVAPIATTEAESLKPMLDRIRRVLSGLGLSEVISYSFINPRDLDAFGLAEGDQRLSVVRLMNPLAEDQSIMRTFLLPSMVSTVARNLRRRNLDLKMFEIGASFIHQASGELPEEGQRLAVAMTGRRFPLSWAWPGDGVDFFDLKGVLEAAFDALGARGLAFTVPDATEPFLTEGTQLDLVDGEGRRIGYMGQLDRKVQDAFDIEQDLFVAELDLDLFSNFLDDTVEFTPIPRYPAVQLDLALLLDDSVRAGDLMEYVYSKAPDLLEKVEIFDLYRGKQVPKGKKSLALRFTYRAPDRTLSDPEVEAVHGPLVESILNDFGATLRG